jgi:hypothetical protein
MMTLSTPIMNNGINGNRDNSSFDNTSFKIPEAGRAVRREHLAELILRQPRHRIQCKARHEQSKKHNADTFCYLLF